VKDRHVTVYDVARRAGVSAATVSRALTGTKVKDKNLARIQQAALELGYVPNNAARSLRSVRTMTVGAVFHQLSGALGIELISALAWGLEKRGYSLFVSTAQGDDEHYDKLVHRFLERRVDALLCIHAAGTGAALDRFIAANIPVAALISQSGGYKRLPLISPGVRQAAKLCVGRLEELGHRHIQVLQPNRPVPPLEEFVSLARHAQMSVDIQDVHAEDFDAEGILRRLQANPGAATVITAPHTLAAQLCVAAERLSLRIPEALSIVAVRDRALQVPATRLSLSMINLDPSKIGSVAAELIVAQLSSGARLKKRTAVETGSWLERDTLGPASH
jgi:LacI family transcriptional regulator, galactose operon repressor